MSFGALLEHLAASIGTWQAIWGFAELCTNALQQLHNLEMRQFTQMQAGLS